MMRRALDLAARGVGLVSPGPLVGTVIVDAHGEIAGEGFYIVDQVKQAERIAVDQVGGRNKAGIVYVSLEPHAHFGRTTPCTDALIKAGIKRVVAPIEDPNPKVSGRGFAHLREAGIEVSTGVLADEAARLNEAYIHFMRTGLPFVHLKLAVSLDGKIATRTGDSRWVAGPESRARAHELRHECDAILVGAGTVAIDDPLLTDRSGRPRRLPLVRVVLDDALELSPESELAKTAMQVPVIVFTGGSADVNSIKRFEAQGVEIVRFNNRDVLPVLKELGARSIQSVLVEGGARITGNFVDAKLINKATFFVAPKIVGGREAPSAVAGAGIDRMADALQIEDFEIVRRGRDIKITGYPETRESGTKAEG